MEKFIASRKQMGPRARTNESSDLQPFNLRTAAIICSLLALILVGKGFAQAQQPDPLTITTDGKVGIGTTAPANKLSVGGNADVSGSLGVGTTTPATKLHVIGSGNALPANSGAVQSAGHVARLKDSSNLILDIGGNGGTGFWFQSTDLLNLATNYPLLLNPNGGNVGIGTTSPQSTLTVGKSTGGGNYAQDAVSGWRDGYLLFRAGAQRASIGMDDSGTKLQLFTGSSSSDGTARLTVDSSGKVGIGTSNPTRGKVEIIGGVGGELSGGYFISPKMVAGNVSLKSDFSLYADNYVAAGGFFAFSDARIKHIEGRSVGARDLATLRGIEVTDYSYIDTPAMGPGRQKKIIGQQVEKVFPQAVRKGTDIVPDIYQRTTMKDGWITLTTDLKKGDRVRLIGEKHQGVFEVLEVAEGRFRTAFAQDGDQVFVYGREVDDARTVDYEAISMLNVSATQELARRLDKLEEREALAGTLKQKNAEVKALQDENAALRSEVTAQAKRLAELEAKDKARDEKLAAIESMLSRQQPSNRSASAKKVN